MTRVRILIILLSVSLQYMQPILTQECGKLNTEYLYNFKKVAELDEFPWIALVGYTDLEKNQTVYKCLAVLVSKRNLISTAYCFTVREKRFEPSSITLGDWNITNTSDEIDCDEMGECTPKPVVYSIENIAVHPNYEQQPELNNLAIIRLTEDVIFTDYIQPICLNFPNESPNYVGQYLEFVGFPSRENGSSVKIKALLRISSEKMCKEYYNQHGIALTDKHLCGFSDSDQALMTGSPLIGVNIVNGEPNNYFLVGILTVGSKQLGKVFPDLLLSTSLYKDWILKNIY